ncbi:DMT family transporter [Paenibacillus sp. y28]|uniref:DMT family transporter n=1 Tax=Paenibacillus sp. y28 TaxID=3129110 RepID=UPI003015BE1C
MWFVLSVSSAVLFGLAGLFMKVSQANKGNPHWLLFGLYVSGTAGFWVNSLWEGTLIWTSAPLWTAGILIGIGSAWGNYVFMKALEYGPASLTSPLTNMNIVLIICMSFFIYHEPIAGAQLAGIGALLLAVVLISIRSKEALTIRDGKWFWLVAAAIILFAIRNGGLKVTAASGLANTPILFYGYLLSAIWFGAAAWRSGKEAHASGSMTASIPGHLPSKPAGSAQASPASADKPAAPQHARRAGFSWGLLAGLFSYGGLQLYSLALHSGPANIVAPIFATNGLVIAAGSIVLYRERLTRLQTAAMACLFVGLILVRI